MTDRNTELLREAFENAFRDKYKLERCNIAASPRCNCGAYIHEPVQALWTGYQAASTRLAEALGVIEELRDKLQDGCLWVREMREGVNKWAGSIEMCGIAARQQNLDSWANHARESLTTAERFMKGEK